MRWCLAEVLGGLILSGIASVPGAVVPGDGGTKTSARPFSALTHVAHEFHIKPLAVRARRVASVGASVADAAVTPVDEELALRTGFKLRPHWDTLTKRDGHRVLH